MPDRFLLEGLDEMIGTLWVDGMGVIGPIVDGAAIMLGPVVSSDDLPTGIGDAQAPGSYALVPGPDDLRFGYAVGPSSLKSLLYPPTRTVWSAQIGEDGATFVAVESDPRPTAVIGVRPCEIAAMRVQDRVLLDGRFGDPDYGMRRERLFLVAVNCTVPADTCFCASMDTGPVADSGFDLALTELGRDRYAGTVGSEEGRRLLERIHHHPLGDDDGEREERLLELAVFSQRRVMPADRVHDLLASTAESPHWDDVSERCLACGNCALVCPTCFCVSSEERVSLDGTTVERARHWDTCFSLEFSYMGGAPARHTIAARYRHWLTHKLSTWVDQFGTLGCVGCGRCITWCPVGIDLTAEIGAITRARHG